MARRDASTNKFGDDFCIDIRPLAGPGALTSTVSVPVARALARALARARSMVKPPVTRTLRLLTEMLHDQVSHNRYRVRV